MFSNFSNWIIFPKPEEGFYEYVAGNNPLKNTDKKKSCFGYIQYPKKWNDNNLLNFFSIDERGVFSENNCQTAHKKTSVGTITYPDKELYLKNINKIKNHIQLGDIYEMNYCISLSAKSEYFDPLHTYFILNKISNAPHSCLAKFGNIYVICASPERFLKRVGDKIITQPIKGTIRRGSTTAEDEQLKSQLMSSEKERSEHIMAVDVARNDLSVIAKPGTVIAEELYGIYSYRQVHQMVSTVSCVQKNNLIFEKIIEATFPMASMTGAPKIRAMQLIDDFENFKREFYSGSIGLILENGDFDFNVVIRSIIYDESKKTLKIAVGSAITHLSDPEAEWEECMVKAKALVAVLKK